MSSHRLPKEANEEMSCFQVCAELQLWLGLHLQSLATHVAFSSGVVGFPESVGEREGDVS